MLPIAPYCSHYCLNHCLPRNLLVSGAKNIGSHWCRRTYLFLRNACWRFMKPEIESQVVSKKPTTQNILCIGIYVYVCTFKYIIYLSRVHCLVMSNSLWPYGHSPLGSSFHGSLQARTLEWVAIPLSRESSPPRNGTWVSCIAGRFFAVWTMYLPNCWANW